MGKVLNELTGPQVFVFQNPRSTKLHITGGYNQPDVKKAFCGTTIKASKVIDARDIAPREGYRDHNKWCKRCLAMLDFEGLDQKVLFSAIQFSKGTYGQLVIAGHAGRRKPALKLSPVPAKPQSYTPQQVAGDVIMTSRVKKKTAKKPLPTGGAIITAPAVNPTKRKTRADKGIKRGPRKPKIDKGANANDDSDVELQAVAKPKSDESNGVV